MYVSPQRSQGITGAQYQKLIAHDPRARSWSWRVMRRNISVYAKGKVRHPDHATILLPDWHRVIMSGEVLSRRVAFLD